MGDIGDLLAEGNMYGLRSALSGDGQEKFFCVDPLLGDIGDGYIGAGPGSISTSLATFATVVWSRNRRPMDNKAMPTMQTMRT